MIAVFFSDVPLTFSTWASKYGGIVKVWIGRTPLIILSDPDFLQVYYTSNLLLDRAYLYDTISAALGKNSLFVGNGG